jgi:hypothetical protein
MKKTVQRPRKRLGDHGAAADFRGTVEARQLEYANSTEDVSSGRRLGGGRSDIDRRMVVSESKINSVGHEGLEEEVCHGAVMCAPRRLPTGHSPGSPPHAAPHRALSQEQHMLRPLPFLNSSCYSCILQCLTFAAYVKTSTPQTPTSPKSINLGLEAGSPYQ